MKKKLILWISAFIITFLIAFLHQRLNPYYPVSGSFGIEGEKITYAFSKLHRGKEPVKILIRTDLDDITGDIFWKKTGTSDWNSSTLTDEGNFLSASVPALKNGETMELRGVLRYKSREYDVPQDKSITMVFSGKRPASVMYVFYFFLFGGLLLAVRGALEFFNPEDKRILFSSLTAMFFFVSAIIFYPFIRTYELGAINRSIPEISTLFDIPLLIVFLISFTAAITILKLKLKIILLITGILIVIIYQFSNFY